MLGDVSRRHITAAAHLYVALEVGENRSTTATAHVMISAEALAISSPCKANVPDTGVVSHRDLCCIWYLVPQLSRADSCSSQNCSETSRTVQT